MSQKTHDPYRNKRIQIIHIGKTQLCLNDEEYRALLKAQSGGKASAGKMNAREHQRVINEMRRLGADIQWSRKRETPSLSDKIHALWVDMAKHGIVHNGHQNALSEWLRGRYGVDHQRFLTTRQAISAIEALKQWQKRKQKKELRS